MATYGWGKGHPVSHGLLEEGHRFTFFQAVRLLELLYPERTPVGEDVDPQREVVRFHSEIKMQFAAGDISALDAPDDPQEPVAMGIHFMALAGSNGPLPPNLTELMSERVFRRDTAMRDFLDIFNHRLISLFYRARKKYRPPLDHRPPDQGRVARCLLAFMGMGTDGLQDRHRFSDRSLLPYTGLFLGSRSMVGLERFLNDYFEFPVHIEPFQGSWHRLDASQWTRLGLSGQNQVLGQSALLGQQVWDQQGSFEVQCGPLTLRQLLDLVPTGKGHGMLCDQVVFYAGDELDFNLRLTLRNDEIPEMRLGQAMDARLGWSARLETPDPNSTASHPQAQLRLGSSGSVRLGWTSWLGGAGDGLDGVICVEGVRHGDDTVC